MPLNYNLVTHGSAKHSCLKSTIMKIRIFFGKQYPSKNALANFKRTDAENVKLFLHKHMFVVVSLRTSADRQVIMILFSSCNSNVM